MWPSFALVLCSRYPVLWSERIRAVFRCRPYKSDLDAVLSKNQRRFLVPTPCCCIPVQPQKIPHHLPQRAVLPSVLCDTSIRPVRSFWELLRNHLSGRLPVIFLVYLCLSIGRTRGHEEGSLLPVSAHLQHHTTCCTVLHCHNTGWCLLLEISILLVAWVGLIAVKLCLFFSISILQPFFLVEDNEFLAALTLFPRPSYEAAYEMAWTLFFKQTSSHALRESRGDTLACLTATTTPMPTTSPPLTSCSDRKELMVPPSHTLQPLWSLKATHYASLAQIRIYPPTQPPQQTYIWGFC